MNVQSVKTATGLKSFHRKIGNVRNSFEKDSQLFKGPTNLSKLKKRV